MLRPLPLANAAGLTTAVFITAGAVVAALRPAAPTTLAEYWLSGVGMTSAGTGGYHMTLGSFLLGVLCMALATWVYFLLLAALYNRFGGADTESTRRVRSESGSREPAGV